MQDWIPAPELMDCFQSEYGESIALYRTEDRSILVEYVDPDTIPHSLLFNYIEEACDWIEDNTDTFDYDNDGDEPSVATCFAIDQDGELISYTEHVTVEGVIHKLLKTK
jgi:hypothetical protein